MKNNEEISEEDKATVNLDLELVTKSPEVAIIIQKAILPEINSFSSKRSEVSFVSDNKILKIRIKSNDISAARASINGILRWIKMSSELFEDFSK